jgi:glycosyltransferase involved in cell wall biosynthesis
MKIAVGITTKNRNTYLDRSLKNHLKHLPPNSRIFIVDDGSETETIFKGFTDTEYHYFPESVGIPKAKNKCLELADAWDADHIFLFDDDIYPIVDDWWKPYVESPEAHFQYCWNDIRPGEYGDAHYYGIGKRFYEDDHMFSFSHPRGQMLYIDAKKVLPRIGGFDPIYGKGMVEHCDWSWRIHNAGLSTWKNQDIVGSENFFYSIDENANSEPDFETTIDNHMRTVIDKANQKILHLKGDSSEYIEYRETIPNKTVEGQNNVVICGVFTGKPDFQINWGARHNSIPDPKHVRHLELDSADNLRFSVAEHKQHLIVLNNINDWEGKYETYIKTGCSEDPYKNRFLKALHYLIEHEEIDNAWIVDSGDVTMLNNPFPQMIPGKIYVGCESNNTLGCNWMLLNTPVQYYKGWLKSNQSRTLLNCGLLGGSRLDLIEYVTKMFYIWGYNQYNMNLTDMLVFNNVAYEHYPDRIVYGVGLVNNKFRSMKPTETKTEWWLHK